MMVPAVVLELLFTGCQLYVTKYDSLALNRLCNSPYLHCIINNLPTRSGASKHTIQELRL